MKLAFPSFLKDCFSLFPAAKLTHNRTWLSLLGVLAAAIAISPFNPVRTFDININAKLLLNCLHHFGLSDLTSFVARFRDPLYPDVVSPALVFQVL